MGKILKGNLLYGQSGGPTSIINSSAYALFKEAFKHEEISHVYALHYGIKGLLENKYYEIFDEEKLEKLLNTPGAFCGSNRYKLESPNSENDEEYRKILEFFKEHNIKYFFYNGGNDSMDTINKIAIFLEKNNYECRCIGINKTIDNDLAETDFSLGYASAAKFIINACLEIYLDDHSYEEGRINIVEVMGRDTGWLAASAKLLELKGIRADFIFVPENPFDLDSFLEKIDTIYKKNKHALVVLSEGIKSKDGKFINEMNESLDAFGHFQLGGAAILLTELIKEKFGYKTRYYEFSLLQRANSMMISKKEQEIAFEISKFALNKALEGENRKVVIVKRTNSEPYTYTLNLIDISKMANVIVYLDKKYIDFENGYINDNFISYLSPLIDGEEGILDIYTY